MKKTCMYAVRKQNDAAQVRKSVSDGKNTRIGKRKTIALSTCMKSGNMNFVFASFFKL